jgi:hypothetical protein
MAAGQTWTGTVRVTVPAPVIGGFDWRVLASGAGPVSESSSTSRAVPWLLIVLALALVGDVVAVVVRWVQRRRARTAASSEGLVTDEPHRSDEPASEQVPTGAMAGSAH